MASRSTFQDAKHWLSSLATNPFFWGGLALLVLVGLSVVFVFNTFVMPSYTRHDAGLTVPNVEQQPFERAAETIQAQGLSVERQEGRFNPNVPQGVVVDQNPPPQSPVKPGRRVYLTVNSGEAPTVVLPDLSGTSIREAENRLSALGLKVQSLRADSIPSPYPETITRQRPEPGDSLKIGKGVQLWYSEGLGDRRASVPNLVGLPVETAQQVLLRQKLRSVVVEGDGAEAETASPDEPDENDARLFVKRQGRQAGTSVRTGTEIRLFATPDSTAAQEMRIAPPDSSEAPRDTSASDASEEGSIGF